MNKLLDPPGIVETVTRYECPRCGNNCSCGLPYVPKTERATEAIKANPGKSNRMIAEEIGASEYTVRQARQQVRGDHAPERAGRDGKTYTATRPPAGKQQVPEPTPPAATDAAARRYLDKIVEAMRPMTLKQREQFRHEAAMWMSDEHIDDDVIPF